MCGIIGSYSLTGKYKAGMEAAIRNLLWADTIRGSDATGLYALDKKAEVDWVKQCTDGWTFLSNNERARNILRDAEDHLIIIGHNRAATLGGNKAEFAHPVVIQDKLGLVHNGTMTYWPGKHKVGATPHDSTAIAELLAGGMTTQEFVDTCHGAYSLVWHDWEKQTLNFLRNDERPMAMVYTEDRMFFGSELLMLNWVVQRHGFKVVKYLTTDPMSKYTFELGESEPKVEKITKSYSAAGGGRFHEGEATDSGWWNRDYYGQPGGHSADRDSWKRRHTPGPVSQQSIEYSRGNATERIGFTPTQRPVADLRTRSRTDANKASETGAEKTASDSEVAEATVQTRHSNVFNLKDKPKGKGVTEYKIFKKDNVLMFSLCDYGEIKVVMDEGQYNIQGEPVNEREFPEVQVRGVVKVKDIDVTAIQKTSNYLLGMISHILLGDTGQVIVWVKDIKMSEIIDPSWTAIQNRIPRTEPKRDGPPGGWKEDKTVSPGVVAHLKAATGALLEKQFCQGCNELLPAKDLKKVTEHSEDPKTSEKRISLFRFCEKCALKYVEKRDTVVPVAAKELVPLDAVFRSLV